MNLAKNLEDLIQFDLDDDFDLNFTDESYSAFQGKVQKDPKELALAAADDELALLGDLDKLESLESLEPLNQELDEITGLDFDNFDEFLMNQDMDKLEFEDFELSDDPPVLEEMSTQRVAAEVDKKPIKIIDAEIDDFDEDLQEEDIDLFGVNASEGEEDLMLDVVAGDSTRGDSGGNNRRFGIRSSIDDEDDQVDVVKHLSREAAVRPPKSIAKKRGADSASSLDTAKTIPEGDDDELDKLIRKFQTSGSTVPSSGNVANSSVAKVDTPLVIDGIKLNREVSLNLFR